METLPTNEKKLLRKLISDALFGLANDIDKHLATELISYHQLSSSQNSDNQEMGGSQMSQMHAWFSTHGGFGDQIYPYGQTLLHMATTELDLDQNEFKEYFRSDGNRDGYNIKNYSSRVREKTDKLRELALQLVSN